MSSQPLCRGTGRVCRFSLKLGLPGFQGIRVGLGLSWQVENKRWIRQGSLVGKNREEENVFKHTCIRVYFSGKEKCLHVDLNTENGQNPVFLEKVIQFSVYLLNYTRLSDTLCREKCWQGLSFFLIILCVFLFTGQLKKAFL